MCELNRKFAMVKRWLRVAMWFVRIIFVCFFVLTILKVCKMANKSGHQHADQFACQVFFNEQFASSFFYCLQLQYPNLSISSQGNQITKCSCFLPRDVFIWYSMFKRRMMWCWKTSNMVLLRPQVCDYISKDLSSIMKLVYHTNVALLPPVVKST